MHFTSSQLTFDSLALFSHIKPISRRSLNLPVFSELPNSSPQLHRLRSTVALSLLRRKTVTGFTPFYCVIHLRSQSSSPMAAAELVKYGFERYEMHKKPLADTVAPYDRHVFLCYKTHESWPPIVENTFTNVLPKKLNSAIKARSKDMKLKTRLTLFEASSSNECSDGDVLVFPQMMKYGCLEDSDLESFVDDVLVNEKPWASGAQEKLAGSYVFICAHRNRDKRCGVCGPILVDKFTEEIKSRGLSNKISVGACSHTGGHKYAGNLIIFHRNADGIVTGDWFGYVTPKDVPDLIDEYIGKGKITEKLWRGQMGMYDPEVARLAEIAHKKKKQKEMLKGAALLGAVVTVAVAYGLYRRSA